MNKKALGDKDIYAVIGNILRWGVYLSMSVVLVGGIIYLVRHGHEQNAFIGAHFIERDDNLLALIRTSIHGVLQIRGAQIITLGILLLIATPIARVVFSFFAFSVEKDKMYMVFTLIVLFIMAFSMFTGFGG